MRIGDPRQAAARRAAIHRLFRVSCLVSGLFGCSPAYDWRETQPSDTHVAALFPCKPDRFSRTVTLAGHPVQMLLLSCTAVDTTFGLSHVQLADPAQVSPALQALRRATTDNVGGTVRVVAPLQVPGMTPSPLAERLQFEGRRPDGGDLRVQAIFFTAGLRVYQATVVGARLDAEAIDTFFAGLRLAPG